jgi:hypothetical protein
MENGELRMEMENGNDEGEAAPFGILLFYPLFSILHLHSPVSENPRLA